MEAIGPRMYLVGQIVNAMISSNTVPMLQIPEQAVKMADQLLDNMEKAAQVPKAAPRLSL